MKKKLIAKTSICLLLIIIGLTGTACEKEKENVSSPETAEPVQEEVLQQEETPEVQVQPEVIPNTEQEEPAEAKLELCQVVHCNEFITLRTEPSTSGEEICKIPLGSDVYYVENAQNGFVKIRYNDQEGYSLASYLNFTKEDGAIFMKVYNCQESITLRKIPNTKAEEFCQIPLGEKVIFREAAENDFYMVSYNGYTGYALAEYLIEW